MNILEDNNRFAISEYQYNLENYLLNANKKYYDAIYMFIKNWLLIKSINIKSLLSINNLLINKLPSLDETYKYYLSNNYISKDLNVKIDKKINIESYDSFFKFIKRLLTKINYILSIRDKKITIKSK